MCGFAGFIEFGNATSDAGERNRILLIMLSRIRHRGPDDQTTHDDGQLALGFCRLSIVDVDGGRQPLWNEAGDILAVVNGEIYNHQDLRRAMRHDHLFSTMSDSEVIPHLYEDRGLHFLDPVNGIFALAIWDRPHQRLLLARDRLGVKPLYFCVVGQKLLFASELKALLAHPESPRRLDWSQIRGLNAVHQPLTPSFVQGIYHLPAGHMIIVEPGKPLRIRPYWSLHEHLAKQEDTGTRKPEDFVQEFGALFDEAVALQLMSDVPLGIFLSGGVDSTLIAAAASHHQADLHCFTISEPTTALTGDLGQAQFVAKCLNFPLHQVEINREGFLDKLDYGLGFLEYMVWCVDEPYVPFEWFFKHELYRFAKTAMPDLKVILSGGGADEFTGGYSASWGQERSSWRQYMDQHVQPRWDRFRMAEDALTGPTAQLGLRQRERTSRSGYQHMMYMNLWSLQFYNLWLEDRTSAAHSIEARVPFLDHRLVELLASVPPAFFEQLFWDKHIVRCQLDRLMPEYPRNYPKVPFVSVPGNDSVKQLERNMVTRAWPEFREKYLDSAHNEVQASQFEAAYQAIEARGQSAAVTSLYKAMQVAIFERNCNEGWKSPPKIPTNSPLAESESLP